MTYLHASFAITANPEPETPGLVSRCGDLKQLEKAYLTAKLRRAGRVSTLATIGAMGCLSQLDRKPTAQELGIFHGSALGHAQESHKVIQQVMTTDSPPSPIAFAGSMANISSFTIAQQAGGAAVSYVLSQDEFSFEAALYSALLALEAEDANLTLVGATDCIFGDRKENLQALGYAENTHLGEGTGWFCLSNQSKNAKGKIIDLKWTKADRLLEETIKALSSNQLQDKELVLIPGLGIGNSLITAFESSFQNISIKPYLEEWGVFPTLSAMALAEAFGDGDTEKVWILPTVNSRQKATLLIFHRFSSN